MLYINRQSWESSHPTSCLAQYKRKKKARVIHCQEAYLLETLGRRRVVCRLKALEWLLFPCTLLNSRRDSREKVSIIRDAARHFATSHLGPRSSVPFSFFLSVFSSLSFKCYSFLYIPIISTTTHALGNVREKKSTTRFKKLQGTIRKLCYLLRSFWSTLKKILYLNPPKHGLLNQLLVKSFNQPYYLVDSTEQCDFD